MRLDEAAETTFIGHRATSGSLCPHPLRATAYQRLLVFVQLCSPLCPLFRFRRCSAEIDKTLVRMLV